MPAFAAAAAVYIRYRDEAETQVPQESSPEVTASDLILLACADKKAERARSRRSMASSSCSIMWTGLVRQAE